MVRNDNADSNLLIFACGWLWAQQPLTNDSITKMVQAGLGEDMIVTLIQQ